MPAYRLCSGVIPLVRLWSKGRRSLRLILPAGHKREFLGVLLTFTLLSSCTSAEPPQDSPGVLKPSNFKETVDLRVTGLDAQPPPYPLAAAYSREDLEGFLEEYERAKDGAVLKEYGSTYGAGSQFSPVSAARFCYWAYNGYVRGETGLRRHIVQQANGLLARADSVATGDVWRYAFPQPTFGAQSGWISGMAQGSAMACLGGAFHVTGNAKYLRAAERAFSAMVAPFGDDGTMTEVGDGVFYEEVAGRGSEPAHILNGMIFALAGIWTLNAINEDAQYEEALSQGIEGVRGVLEQYDAPGASLYDLVYKRTARLGVTGVYNIVHVAQLQWMYEVSRDPAFLETAFSFLENERNLPYTAEASSFSPDHGTEALTGEGSYFAAPTGESVELTVNLDEPAAIDRLYMVSYADEMTPSEVEVRTGDHVETHAPVDRFASLPIDVEEPIDQLSISMTPQTGSRIALFLVGLSAPSSRSLVALPSDLDPFWRQTSLWDAQGPLNASDGDPETMWSTDHQNPWLVVKLGETAFSKLALQPCREDDPPEVRFGADLRTWGPLMRPDKHGEVPIPPDASYALFRWRGKGACVKEITGRTT